MEVLWTGIGARVAHGLPAHALPVVVGGVGQVVEKK